MRPITRDLLTGTVVTAALSALVVMLFVFGELSRIGRDFYSFTVRLDTARGLTSTSPVTLNGVRVGSLKGLANAPDPREGVDLVIEVEQGTVVPSDFGVFLDRGLLSGAAVELVVDPDSVAPTVTDGDVFVRIAETTLGQLKQEITQELDERLGGLGVDGGGIGELIETYAKLGTDARAALAELTEPRTIEEVAAGAAPNVRSTLARLDALAADASRVVGSGGIADSASAQVDAAGALIEDLRGAARALQTEIEKASAVIAGFGESSARIAAAAGQAEALVADVRAGEGTLGQLATNPDLFNAMRSAAERLEATLREAQLLIEKYRSEGVPIRF